MFTPTERRLLDLLPVGEWVPAEDIAKGLGWWYEGAPYSAISQPLYCLLTRLRRKGICSVMYQRKAYRMGTEQIEVELPPLEPKPIPMSVCRECGREFEPRKTGGRPYWYCEDHRGLYARQERYRAKIARDRASRDMR